jgi:hypothetical protein
MQLYGIGDQIYIHHHNGTVGTSALVTIMGTNDGDVLEIVATLRVNGDVHLIASANGTAPVQQTGSGAIAFVSPWELHQLWLGGVNGGNSGVERYADLRVAKLADMTNVPGTATALDVLNEMRGFVLDAAGNLMAT